MHIQMPVETVAKVELKKVHHQGIQPLGRKVWHTIHRPPSGALLLPCPCGCLALVVRPIQKQGLDFDGISRHQFQFLFPCDHAYGSLLDAMSSRHHLVSTPDGVSIIAFL